jgi:hypothetical protein
MPERGNTLEHDEDDWPMDFQTRIAHAQSGYQNGQEVIKFIDTKSGVVTGLAGILLGFPLAVLKWSFELDEAKPAYAVLFNQTHPKIAGVILFGFFVAMCLGMFSVLASTFSLMGRNPRRPYQGIFELLQKCVLRLRKKPLAKGSEAVTILFPIYSEPLTSKAHEYFKRLSGDFGEGEMLREYELQLAEIGRILNLKIRWHRRAVSALQFQVITLVVTSIVAGIGLLLLH